MRILRDVTITAPGTYPMVGLVPTQPSELIVVMINAAASWVQQGHVLVAAEDEFEASAIVWPHNGRKYAEIAGAIANHVTCLLESVVPLSITYASDELSYADSPKHIKPLFAAQVLANGNLASAFYWLGIPFPEALRDVVAVSPLSNTLHDWIEDMETLRKELKALGF